MAEVDALLCAECSRVSLSVLSTGAGFGAGAGGGGGGGGGGSHALAHIHRTPSTGLHAARRLIPPGAPPAYGGAGGALQVPSCDPDVRELQVCSLRYPQGAL